jgi:hypothetical protein
MASLPPRIVCNGLTSLFGNLAQDDSNRGRLILARGKKKLAYFVLRKACQEKSARKPQ